MQNRFVVNGIMGDTQAVVLAYELNEADFKINLHVVDRKSLTAAQNKSLNENWVAGEAFEFPVSTKHINPDINQDSMVPDDIKSDKTGEIRHFQNEWAVQLLTNKLWAVYLIKLEELKAKSNELTAYSRELFEDTKSFWEQILENKKERNITQSRLDKIKEDVNEIFEKLKTFRKTESEEFDKISRAVVDEVVAKLEAVKKKVEASANFKDLADEIKKIQSSIRNQRLSKTHELTIRKAFDDAFHFLHETRESFFSSRIDSRVAGLKEVIGKMEASIARDKKDLDYFTSKADKPRAGDLEVQLLKVRLRQITETMQSKEEKLKDIYKTLDSLLRQTNPKGTTPEATPTAEGKKTKEQPEPNDTSAPSEPVTEA